MDMSTFSDYVTQRRGNPSSGPLTHEDMLRYENRIISRLDSWFERCDGKFTQITNDLEDVKNSLQFMSDKYEHLKNRKKLNNMSKFLNERINEFKSWNQKWL